MLEKYNILFLTKTMDIGGTERVVLQLCKNFKDKFGKIVVCSAGGIYEKDLNAMNITHYRIPDFDAKHPINQIITLYKLIKIIKKEKINIIHTHHRYAAFFSKIVGWFINIKNVYTAHNSFNDKKLFTRFSLPKYIISVGDSVKKNLIDVFNISSDNITTIYNGVEYIKPCNDDIEEIMDWKSNKYFIVGNIGRLSQQKGMEIFINCIPIVISKCNDIRFVIIGDGEDRKKLERQIEELNIQKYVRLLGFRSDIYNIINNLDLFVLSSLWEGFPLTPIEVFSQGNTIIATDIPGTREIVKNGFNGILVKNKDYVGIANEIINLYKDRNRLQELKSNAAKTYYENFTEERMIKSYYDYYCNLLKDNGK